MSYYFEYFQWLNAFFLHFRSQFDPFELTIEVQKADLQPDHDMKKMVKNHRSKQILETSV